jgi:mannitol/fructose-specific phosphotransferase system IIA component (Ntr-type)
MVGVVPIEELSGDLTPVASAARGFLGDVGAPILSVAALLAFISVANAGIMSASRYPLAMSRDQLFPHHLKKLSNFGTPIVSILLTVLLVILILVFLNPTGIAKLASAFQLLMFSIANFAVIVMRESRIQSYDPGYRSPLYPWMQIFGILSPLVLIVEMGFLTIIFSIALVVIGLLWFAFYGKKYVTRTGAIHHVFERLGRQRNENLDSELRGILKEKGLRQEDPFEDIIMRSKIFDIEEESTFEEVTEKVAHWLQSIIPLHANDIKKHFLDGTRIGMTPVTHGVALPHLRVEGMDKAEMVLLRSKPGINIKVYNPITHEQESESIVHAIFFLVSPEKNPTQHLRILAQIAGRVDEETFSEEWFQAEDEQEIKETLFHDERFLSLCISSGSSTSVLLNKSLKEVNLPEGCLVAMLRRGGNVIIPRGDTEFEEGDRITIIGDVKGLEEIKSKYPDGQVG